MAKSAAVNTGERIAKASLVVGIIAIASAFVPFVNNLAWAVGLAGIVVAAIALMNSANKRLPTIGLMLSLFAGGIGLFMAAVYAVMFTNAA